ncbi:uncharacterized protein LOC126265013 [Aethina tumida]|uniref:uncharacterized protein LOC126265013 n=1 Tax=Aethina tumida TaxID=116153 RepID=UPI00214865B0|nr:uncharacterized protein LOC126265013 [Aethina tumida]
MHMKVAFYLSLCACWCTINSQKFDTKNCRLDRGCRSNESEDEDGATFYRKTIFENPTYLTLIVILGVFFTLLLLGFLKGLLGLLISKKIGMAGLHMLIDLPRTMYEYQESKLKHRCIIYDVAGWPVHPDTQERSVRVMTKKMEFCLNLVFFLVFPMSQMLNLCSMCCCIETVNEHDEEGKLLEQGNISMDMYHDGDLKEDLDTNYVINILKTSKLSLCQNH